MDRPGPFTHLLNTLDGMDLMPLPERDRIRLEEAIRATEWTRPWLYDAAPALLEALERIAKWSEDTDRYATATLERMVATAGKRARAAIAQAKGEK